MRGANVRDNVQGGFVQDYAAKRAAQMERARQIREERRAGGGATTPTYERDGPEPSGKPSSGSPARYAQSNRRQTQSDEGGDYEEDRYAGTGDYGSTANSLPSDGGYSQGSLDNTARSSRLAVPRQQQQPLSADVGVSRQNYVSREPVASSGRPSTGTSQVREVMVTEADFKVAVSRGILTPDQARQLWGILTDPTAQDRLNSVRPAGNRAPPQQTHQQKPYDDYDHGRYAPPEGTANHGVYNAPPSSHVRGGGGYDDEDNYGGSMSGRRPIEGTRRAPPPQQQQQQRQHQQAQYDEDEYGGSTEYNPPSARTTKKPVAGGPKGRALPEWNSDFVESSIPSDAPPVGGRGAGRRPIGNGASSRQPARAPSPPPMQFGDGGYDDEGDSYNRQPQQRQQPQQSRRQPSSTQGGARQPPARGGGGYNDRGGGGGGEYGGSTNLENDDLNEIKAQKVAEFERALEEADPQEPQVPCGICGRTFRRSLIPRHETACAKASTKKRKTFDMTKARIGEIEGAGDIIRQIKRNGGVLPEPAKKQLAPGKLPKWKLQHQQFQAVLKNVNGASGGVTGPPVMTHPDLDDRVPCPHCGRKFAEDTAERHIPKCATIRCNKPKGSIPNRPPRR